MEKMWAPWRMEYISGIENDDGCFFCRALASDDDEASLVVVRDPLCFCMLNRFPYNNGHVLIAPNVHKGAVEELTPEERLGMFDLAVYFKKVADEIMRPDGYNIGFNLGRAAGAGVIDHVHLHVVPRWQGDTNFMPVLADIKVIPQALQSLLRQARDAMASIPR